MGGSGFHPVGRQDKMEITINGQTETVAPCTLSQLVRQKGLDPHGLVIEHNLKIIRQAQWDTLQLRENDTLELLSFVGGG